MATINRYGEGDIVLSTDKVVASAWSDNTNNLTTFETSSIQATQTDANSQGNFFIEVYNEATSSTNSAVQYAVAYGNRVGSGSPDFTNDSNINKSDGSKPCKMFCQSPCAINPQFSFKYSSISFHKIFKKKYSI